MRVTFCPPAYAKLLYMVYSYYEYQVIESDEVRITRCMLAQPDMTIPAQIEGRAVTSLGPDSFARLSALESIKCPAHLREIGPIAFAGCRKLKNIVLNDALISIGNGAFANTALRELNLPASCTELAPRALVIGPAPDGQPVRAHGSLLERISVAEGNEALVVEGGTLCRRAGNGLEVLLAPNRIREVRLSRRVRTVLEGAFAGTRELGTLHVHDELRYEGSEGLLPHGSCKRLIVDLARPIGNVARIDIEVPAESAGETFIARALSLGHINCAHLLRAYDETLNALPASHDKARLVAARLANPVLLDPAMRNALEQFERGNLNTICESFGARNHLAGFGNLVDAGILDITGISDAVAALARRGDTAAAGRLLELKRVRFGKAALDYAL